MKKMYYLTSLTLMLFFVLGMFSCSQNGDILSDVPASSQTRVPTLCQTKEEAREVLMNYEELHVDKYVLNISKAEAEKIGVPSEFYDETQAHLAEVNESIQEQKKDPNVNVVLHDPKSDFKTHIYINEMICILDPYGYLTTNGTEETKNSNLRASYQIRGIEFLCRANSSRICQYTCKTFSAGIWESRTEYGNGGITSKIKVPIHYSKDPIDVYFSTTDPNGATASYHGHL